MLDEIIFHVGIVISPQTLLDMRLFVHAGIKFNPG